jgi:cytochrome c-type biogenesis protein CcmF
MLVPFVMGSWSALSVFGLLLAFWVAFGCIGHVIHRVRSSAAAGGVLAKLRSLPRAYWGMQIAHFGIAVFIIGVTMVKTYESSKDVKMQPGSTTEVGGFSFQFVQIGEIKGPNYVAARAVISVSKNGVPVKTMFPEKRMYTVQQMPMTEAAIDYGLTRDLYVALGEAIDESTWIVRVHHKPFVNWIWLGCVLMGLGGILAASDRRYRVGAKRAEHVQKISGDAAAQPV